MKYLTVFALLLSSSVIAQNKSVTQDTSKRFGKLGAFTTKGVSQGNGFITDGYFTRSAETKLILLRSEPRTLMTVTQRDSSGVYKVWFDKRAVKFTSDSTFTITEKP